MIDIKPKLIQIYFKRFTKEMIKAYIRRVREDFEYNRPEFLETPETEKSSEFELSSVHNEKDETYLE